MHEATRVLDDTPLEHLSDCEDCGAPIDIRNGCVGCKGPGEEGEMTTQQIEDTKKSDKLAKNGVPAKEQAQVDAMLALPPGVTTSALNSAVTEFHKLKAVGACNYWDLGAKAQEIHAKQLWKARVTEKGKPAYTNFEGFCLSELGMKATSVFDMMDVSKAFPREHVLQYGSAKLGLVLKAPPEDQPKLLEIAGKSSWRKLKEHVSKAREEKGLKKRVTGRKPMQALRQDLACDDGMARQGRQSNGIRQDSPLARLLYNPPAPLFKKSDKKGYKLTDQPRAKKLGDAPIGCHVLPNGVELWLSVSANAAGDLQLKCTMKRAAEEAK